MVFVKHWGPVYAEITTLDDRGMDQGGFRRFKTSKWAGILKKSLGEKRDEKRRNV